VEGNPLEYLLSIFKTEIFNIMLEAYYYTVDEKNPSE
jgi:hypothetical protein